MSSNGWLLKVLKKSWQIIALESQVSAEDLVRDPVLSPSETPASVEFCMFSKNSVMFLNFWNGTIVYSHPAEIDFIPFFATFVSCILLGLEYGILIGIGCDVLILLFYSARPELSMSMEEVRAVRVVSRYLCWIKKRRRVAFVFSQIYQPSLVCFWFVRSGLRLQVHPGPARPGPLLPVPREDTGRDPPDVRRVRISGRQVLDVCLRSDQHARRRLLCRQGQLMYPMTLS